jgi:hypothetical protein
MVKKIVVTSTLKFLLNHYGKKIVVTGTLKYLLNPTMTYEVLLPSNTKSIYIHSIHLSSLKESHLIFYITLYFPII